MKIRMRDGRELAGTPIQIVQQMQSIAFGRERDTLAAYVGWVQRQTLEFEGIELKIDGTSDEEQAKSLVDELVRTQLAKRL